MEDETHGILQVGEVPVIRRRDSFREQDHSQAFRSGRENALGETLAYVVARLAATPEYEDTRPWTELMTFLRDKIKESADAATTV